MYCTLLKKAVMALWAFMYPQAAKKARRMCQKGLRACVSNHKEGIEVQRKSVHANLSVGELSCLGM